MSDQTEREKARDRDREDERQAARPACPVCGQGPLVEQRGKLVCAVPDHLRDLLRGRARLRTHLRKVAAFMLLRSRCAIALVLFCLLPSRGFGAGAGPQTKAAPASPRPIPSPAPPSTASTPSKASTIKIVDGTPEDALRTFMLAVLAQDGAALRAVTLPSPDLGLLLNGQGAPAEVVKAATEQFARLPMKRLKPGETIALTKNKPYIVSASEVGDDRAILLPQGSPVPTRLQRVKGRWKVAADPFIAARKAADVAKKKAEARKAAAESPR